MGDLMKTIKVKKLKKKIKKLRKIKVEIFKSIYIEEEKTKYLISNYGRVYNSKSKKFLKPYLNRKGYCVIGLQHNGKRYRFSIHRLVAIAFIPQLDKNRNQVNHKNGKKKDNRKKNLEWCSCSENIQHAFDIGLKKPRIGEMHSQCKTTEKQVEKICELLSLKKYTMVKIANLTNTNKDIVNKIKRRKNWKHISKNYKW